MEYELLLFIVICLLFISSISHAAPYYDHFFIELLSKEIVSILAAFKS